MLLITLLWIVYIFFIYDVILKMFVIIDLIFKFFPLSKLYINYVGEIIYDNFKNEILNWNSKQDHFVFISNVIS